MGGYGIWLVSASYFLFLVLQLISVKNIVTLSQIRTAIV